MRLLEALGYECFRMAGSLGVFDVIGVSPSDVLLVQVKSNRPPSSVEIEAIRNFRNPPNSRKLIHVWRDRESLPVIREM